MLNYRDVDSPNGPEREQSLDRRLSTEKFESLARFAGGVAHDFNNQLTVILGQTEWLAGLAGSESARLAIDEVERAAVRLTNLVREFGSYGGHEYPETITADLARLVLDLVEESRPSLPERIRLEVAAAPDCEALVDAEMFREALRALLHNAVEALCVGPGRILIEVGSLEATPENLEDFFDAGHALTQGTYHQVAVSDDGSGIASEDLSRVFDPFYTTSPTSRGLGLPRVLGVVRAHKGGIRFESELGRGTKATLLFHAA